MMKFFCLVFLFYTVHASTLITQQNANIEEPYSHIMENLAIHTSQVAQNNDDGPISNIMDNLAIHTASVTEQLVSQMVTKIERTTKTLVGNIEVVVGTALNELYSTSVAAQNTINSPECQATLSMDELQQRIDISLITCTQNLTAILTTFQNDSEEFERSLQVMVKDITDLPNQCHNLENTPGFSGTVSCFVEKIADINQQIAVVLNRASMTLVHTRQLAEQGVQSARSCADDVVVDTLEYLNDILSKCEIAQN